MFVARPGTGISDPLAPDMRKETLLWALARWRLRLGESRRIWRLRVAVRARAQFLHIQEAWVAWRKWSTQSRRARESRAIAKDFQSFALKKRAAVAWAAALGRVRSGRAMEARAGEHLVKATLKGVLSRWRRAVPLAEKTRVAMAAFRSRSVARGAQGMRRALSVWRRAAAQSATMRTCVRRIFARSALNRLGRHAASCSRSAAAASAVADRHAVRTRRIVLAAWRRTSQLQALGARIAARVRQRRLSAAFSAALGVARRRSENRRLRMLTATHRKRSRLRLGLRRLRQNVLASRKTRRDARLADRAVSERLVARPLLAWRRQTAARAWARARTRRVAWAKWRGAIRAHVAATAIARSYIARPFSRWKAMARDRVLARLRTDAADERLAFVLKRRAWRGWLSAWRAHNAVRSRAIATVQRRAQRASLVRAVRAWRSSAASARLDRQRLARAGRHSRREALRRSVREWITRARTRSGRRAQDASALGHWAQAIQQRFFRVWDVVAFRRRRQLRTIAAKVSRVQQIRSTSRRIRMAFEAWRGAARERAIAHCKATRAARHYARVACRRVMSAWARQAASQKREAALVQAIEARRDARIQRRTWDRWVDALGDARLALHKQTVSLEFWRQGVLARALSQWRARRARRAAKAAREAATRAARARELVVSALRRWVSTAMGAAARRRAAARDAEARAVGGMNPRTFDVVARAADRWRRAAGQSSGRVAGTDIVLRSSASSAAGIGSRKDIENAREGMGISASAPNGKPATRVVGTTGDGSLLSMLSSDAPKPAREATENASTRAQIETIERWLTSARRGRSRPAPRPLDPNLLPRKSGDKLERLRAKPALSPAREDPPGALPGPDAASVSSERTRTPNQGLLDQAPPTGGSATARLLATEREMLGYLGASGSSPGLSDRKGDENKVQRPEQIPPPRVGSSAGGGPEAAGVVAACIERLKGWQRARLRNRARRAELSELQRRVGEGSAPPGARARILWLQQRCESYSRGQAARRAAVIKMKSLLGRVMGAAQLSTQF